MIKWWETMNPGSLTRVILLQIDLEGHSAWFKAEDSQSRYDAYEKRSELAASMERGLAGFGYHRLFWAGDGGVFACRMSQEGFVETLCQAADRAFKNFASWKESHGSPSPELGLRVTAECIEVTLDAEVGNWSSPDLNKFLKYERNIGSRDCFTITNSVRRLLREECAKRFDKEVRVNLPTEEITVFRDSINRPKVGVSQVSFKSWLQQKVESDELPNLVVKDDVIEIGSCTLLDAAQNCDGYGSFELDALSPIEYKPNDEQERQAWEVLRQGLISKNVRGRSLSIVRFRRELLDDPHPRIEYRVVDYADARAFLKVQQENEQSHQKYLALSSKVLGDGYDFMNILSIGIILIIGSSDEPEFVIARRKGRSDSTGGFEQGLWSVAAGEQFIPESGPRGDRDYVERDRSILACCYRGLREEILGDGNIETIKASVHSLIREDDINNFVLMAVADIRPFTFDRLVGCWIHARDYEEHSALVSIPLTREKIDRILGETDIPGDILRNAESGGRSAVAFGNPSITEGGCRWQGNSRSRLVLARWYLDTLSATV